LVKSFQITPEADASCISVQAIERVSGEIVSAGSYFSQRTQLAIFRMTSVLDP
jgi:hypothetical protein